MKKIIVSILMINSLVAVPNNPDFARRFGSNSPIFNIPLYFAKGRCNFTRKKKTVSTYQNQDCKKRANTIANNPDEMAP